MSTTTGPLSPEQRLWMGVLHGGPTAMIGGLSATEHHRLKGWHRDEITVLVANEMSFEPLEGYRFIRTRRSFKLLVTPGELPVCRLEPAVLIFASLEPGPAYGARRGHRDRPAAPHHHRASPRLDRPPGAVASRPPHPRPPRRDRSGRLRHTDCEWRLPDGRTLVLEVLGAFHDDVLQAMEDRRRNRKLTTPHAWCSSAAPSRSGTSRGR